MKANRMKTYELDKDEQDILDHLDEFESILTPESKAFYEQVARNTLERINKTKSISIRLTEKDLIELKSRAEETGIPYQTLVTSLIRQFNNRKIKLEL